MGKNKINKALRREAKKRVDEFDSDAFVQFIMSLSFWTRLRFCLGIMIKREEKEK